MIEEVVSVDLAVHERLTVRKNRLAPKQLKEEMKEKKREERRQNKNGARRDEESNE